jgi:hypothetical protein
MVNTIGTVRGHLQQRDKPGAAGGQNNVRRERHQLLRLIGRARPASPSVKRRSICRLGPSVQPNCRSPSDKSVIAGAPFRVALREIGQHADPAHALALLRPRYHGHVAAAPEH